MEEENQSPVSHNRAAKKQASAAGPAARSKSRFAGVDESGDPIECSGKYCRSCTAGLVADCVALCCCPCAVLHFLALAFFKAPLMAGRKCLGLAKKKKKKCMSDGYDVVLQRDRVRNLEKGRVEDSKIEEVSCESARFEADKVWLELYQIGHLGFGRVSFKEN